MEKLTIKETELYLSHKYNVEKVELAKGLYLASGGNWLEIPKDWDYRCITKKNANENLGYRLFA